MVTGSNNIPRNKPIEKLNMNKMNKNVTANKMHKSNKYAMENITFRKNNEGCPIRTLHPLDPFRYLDRKFVTNITNSHKSYWIIANSQSGNLILIIPRNAFKRRGRCYVQRPNQPESTTLEKTND